MFCIVSTHFLKQYNSNNFLLKSLSMGPFVHKEQVAESHVKRRTNYRTVRFSVILVKSWNDYDMSKMFILLEKRPFKTS